MLWRNIRQWTALRLCKDVSNSGSNQVHLMDVLDKRRPFRATIIGILSIVAGLIYLFPVLDVYGLGDLIKLSAQSFQAGPLVLTAFVLAIANFILGVGCLYGWRPIWFYLVIISVINFLVALIALLNANFNNWDTMPMLVVWFVISIYVLYSVQTRKTRTWFHI